MDMLIRLDNNEKIKNKECIFCGEDTHHIFSIIDTNDQRMDMYKMKSFSICEKDLTALNHLLDGSYSIARIEEAIIQVDPKRSFNLREYL